MDKNQKPGYRKLYFNTNLQIIFGITLISVMGVASLTPAFPRIGRAFNVSMEDIGLMITAFTLPGIFLTPVLGLMADRYGRKKILVPSLFLFAIAGTACFFARDYDILLLFRFLQGSGAAALGALNITLIGDIFSKDERPAAMGFNSAVLSIGTASYPIIGGALASIAWYYPFLLPILGLFVGLAVILFLKNPEPKTKPEFWPYLKNIFLSLKDSKLIGLFLISVLTFIILYGPYLTYFPFIIENTFGQPPYIVGIVMSFASIASFFTSNSIGYLSKMFSERQLIIYSCFFYIGSMVIVPFLGNVWLMLIPSILFGIAQGANLPSLFSLLTSFVPMSRRASIMSLNGMLFRIGQTLGPVSIAPIYVYAGLQGVFIFGGVIGAIMLVVAIFIVRQK